MLTKVHDRGVARLVQPEHLVKAGELNSKLTQMKKKDHSNSARWTSERRLQKKKHARACRSSRRPAPSRHTSIEFPDGMENYMRRFFRKSSRRDSTTLRQRSARGITSASRRGTRATFHKYAVPRRLKGYVSTT